MNALYSTNPRSFASLEADTKSIIPWRSVGVGEAASGPELVLHQMHTLDLSSTSIQFRTWRMCVQGCIMSFSRSPSAPVQDLVSECHFDNERCKIYKDLPVVVHHKSSFEEVDGNRGVIGLQHLPVTVSGNTESKRQSTS